MGWHCSNCNHWIVDNKFTTCTYCGTPRYANSAQNHHRAPDTAYYGGVHKTPGAGKAALKVAVVILLLVLLYVYRAQVLQMANGAISALPDSSKNITAGVSGTIGNSTHYEDVIATCQDSLQPDLNVMQSKLPSGSQVNIVNTTTFKNYDNMSENVNAWLSEWSSVSVPGKGAYAFTAISCPSRSSEPMYFCNDLKTIMNESNSITSNTLIGVGVIVKVQSATSYSGSFESLIPVLCTSNGTLMANSNYYLTH